MKISNAKINFKNSFLLFITTLLFSYCSIKKSHTSDTENSSHTKEISEKYWKLIALHGKTVTTSARQEREVYMILKTHSSKLKGFAGCNNFTGNYQLMKNDEIKFLNFATGKKYYFIPTNEHEFLNVLKSAEGFKTKQDTLWLTSKKIKIARFEAVYF